MMRSLSLNSFVNLFQYTAVGFVAFLRPYLTGHEQELVGDDGQAVPAEALDAVAFGKCRLHQVTESPRYIIAVAIQIPFFGFGRAH